MGIGRRGGVVGAAAIALGSLSVPAPGHAASWGAPHTLAAKNLAHPAVAMSPNGHLAVAFAKGRSYAIARARPGGRLGRAQIIPGSRSAAASDLKVAVNDRGDVAVVWDDFTFVREDDPESEDCCAFVKGTTAAARGGPRAAQSMTSGREDSAVSRNGVVAIGAHGRAALLYDTECDPYVRTTKAGRPFGSAIRVHVSKSETCEAQKTPPAVLANGDALITYAWERAEGEVSHLSSFRVTPAGGVHRREIARGRGGGFLNPMVATSAGGSRVVLYGTFGDAERTRLATVPTGPSRFRSRVVGASSGSGTFSLGGASNGAAIALVDGARGGTYRVALRRANRPLGRLQTLGPRLFLYGPDLAISHSGKALISSGSGNELELRMGRNARALRRAHRIRCHRRCETQVEGPIAPLAMDSGGRAAVVWRDGTLARIARYR